LSSGNGCAKISAPTKHQEPGSISASLVRVNERCGMYASRTSSAGALRHAIGRCTVTQNVEEP
jgi:hypothetical protein